MRGFARLLLAAGSALWPAFAGELRADSFPPIAAAEQALKAVPGEPNAPAVVLYRKGELQMLGWGRQDLSSWLIVDERVKILTDRGKSWGEVSVPHSDFVRLHRFRGRTVLPDGRVLPLPDDAKFRRQLSRTRHRYVTSVAFPGVEVGAILDYHYELVFDSPFFLEPWYFSSEVPVLFSQVIYDIPQAIKAVAWSRDAFAVGIRHENASLSRRGTSVRAWAENLPAITSEPLGLPFGDLATQMMLVPTVFDDGVQHTRLFESWASTSDRIGERYEDARRKDGGVAAKARDLAAHAGAGQREKAAAIYRFVRDEIASRHVGGVTLDPGSSIENVLSRREGDYAEKALLLEAMLKAAGIEARPVWAAERGRGLIDPQLPTPGWFDLVLVAAEVGGHRLYLDPSDRALGFGALPPDLEGTIAVLPDRKKPEQAVLPETPCSQSGRSARVELTLDAKGRLQGNGELRLSGHRAWEALKPRKESGDTASERWKEWLEGRYREFQLDRVKVEESPDDRTVLVTWSMAQREQEVLGDQSTLIPSLPLGPATQRLAAEAGGRRSPVLFPYAEREEVELVLRWPEGWRLEAQPPPAREEKDVGALVATTELRAAERSLTYRRRLDICQKVLAKRAEYETMRALFDSAVKNDAQALSLVRR